MAEEILNSFPEDELRIDLGTHVDPSQLPDQTTSSVDGGWRFPPKSELHAALRGLQSQTTAGDPAGVLGMETQLLRLFLGRELCPLPLTPVFGDLEHLQSVHTAGYAAQLYSYIFAKAAANTVWTEVFQRQASGNRTAGDAWRKEVLAEGGGREWKTLLRDFLRRNARQKLSEDGRVELLADPQEWWEGKSDV